MPEEVKEFNVVLTGVGGQGTIAMSEVLGMAAVLEGHRVRGSEVLGMAQRGGAVVTHLRLGRDVYGPTVPEGKADVMVALEPSEALRNLRYVTKNTIVVLGTRPIVPPSVSLGISRYPSVEEVVEKLKELSDFVITIDPYKLAAEAGDVIAANMVMLGALAGTGRLPIKVESLKQAIRERFKG
ncbi:indolepyruvate ferredoxin oxidoreductase subunit beta [Candidatus Geothermarchaeota archaeon ex4572_27]|nr:MAG: indolepyruvate ferredoxin oxidoreductase subunit beta [Candidatus Geothermarchaeota archaeon ex4572_27]